MDSNVFVESRTKDRRFEKISSKRRNKKFSAEKKVKLDMNYRKLQTFGKVWEFGYELDLANSRDARNYIVYMADWVNTIKLPQTVAGLRDFVSRHKKDHRLIVWRMLANAGNLKCKALINAHIDKLTQPKLS